jgi:YVTN family beta-propeller protein
MKKTFTKRRIAIIGGVIFSLAVFAFIFLVLPIYADTPCSKIDTSTLRVGGNPDDIAINPHTNNVYVATTNVGNSSSNIAIVDCGKNSIRGSIHLPNTLHPHLAVNNQTNKIYVANAGSNTISVIDGTNLKIISDVQVGLHPTDVSVNPKTDKIYVANAGSNTVYVIDSSLKNTRNVAVGLHPTNIAVNPNTDKIYVANAGSNTVYVIDGHTDKVIRSIPIGRNPSAIFVNKDTNRVYIANKGSNTVSVIDGGKADSVINTISVGNGPTDLVADYDQQKNINKIYVANWYSETISVIAPGQK